MANQRHVDILLRDGVALWNQWRKEEPSVCPDLKGANLMNAPLSGANLQSAGLAWSHLSGADLMGADLRGADLMGADLAGAHFTGADLTCAHLNEADLIGARLSSADLSGADLLRAKLMIADLSRANLSRANLDMADLNASRLIEARLIEACLRETNLSGVDLTDADLTGADLTGAVCIRTRFSGATLTGCTVYGISAWDVHLDNAKQTDLRITPGEMETNITVDNLEVAQFLYLLLNNPKVRDVLDTITSKVVLILGRFSDERKPILDAVRDALRSHPNGYIPVLFDFEPQQDKPVFETVKTLANLARFVIADLTDPRMVRSELTYIIPNVPTVPVQPIMQSDAHLPPEYETWALYKSFLSVYRYTDLPKLLANLTDAVIAPVEGHVHARRLTDADSPNTAL